jgi:hypothetical protein
MADDGNPEDLVSKVTIQGTEDSAAQLEKLADSGEKSFNRLSDAADKSSKKVKSATTDISKGLQQVEKSAPTPAASLQFDNLAKATTNLGQAVKKGVKDVVEFGARVVALGAAGAAAGAGLLVFARSVAQQVNSATDAVGANLSKQTAALATQQQAATSAIQYQSQLRVLNQQLRTGAIDYDTYNKALQSTRASYQEQMRVQNQLNDVQEETRIATEKLQKQAADTKAYDALVDKFGGPLVSSLTQLGTRVETLRKELVQSFGPGLSDLVDVFTSTLNANSTAISNFATNTGRQITQFVSQNKTQIVSAITGIAQVAAVIVQGIIAIGPTVLHVINDVFLPAFRAVMTVLDQVAKSINDTFGTNINGVFLIGVIAVLKFTKAMQALFGVLKIVATAMTFFKELQLALTVVTQGATGLTAVVRVLLGVFGPWGIAIGLIAAALALLLTQVDWKAFAASAVAAKDSIVAGWNSLVLFFTTLPLTLGQLFAALWAGAVTLATNAVAAVVGAWNGLVEGLAGIGASITDMFTALWTSLTENVSETVQGLIDLWTSFIDFLGTIPDTVTGFFTTLTTNISDLFKNAIDSVISVFQNLYNKAVEFLSPIIDLLKTINSLMAGADASSSAGEGRAHGGHIRGPGTSTSDSIPIWASANEFMMQAKAVSKYGLSFMRAVNSGRFDPRAIVGYATGGLIPAPSTARMPNFKGSTSPNNNESLRPLSLTIGNDVFDGLLAPEHVANKITLYSVRKQSRSAGKKPTWFGNGN